MKYAVIESGGKQYRVVEGATLEVDRLPVEAGQEVLLDSVLLLVNDDSISVGAPALSGVTVKTTVVEHTKGPKIVVFKYRPKKRIRVKTGHRQQYTCLKVNSIEEK